jgi:hypothetical protein
LGFILNKLIGDLGHYFSDWTFEMLVAALVAACSLLAIVYIFLMLFPRINPLEHVVVPQELKPAFFVSAFHAGEIAGKKRPFYENPTRNIY